MVDRHRVIDLLTKHEGFRATCYRDTVGKLTIGIGFNLDAAGAELRCIAAELDYAALRGGQAITLEQAQALLAEGIQSAQDVATITVPGFPEMPDNVQLVIIDMIFNLGSAGFHRFHVMIAALIDHDWLRAANAMRASLWYGQVGVRATNDIALLLGAAAV